MEAWSSGWSDSQKKEILKIAENAIQSINELTNIVGRSSVLSGSSSSADSLHSTNAVQELHYQFPTVDFRGRNTTCSVAGYSCSTSAPSTRTAPYSQCFPGRPTGSLTVTKDVVIIEYGHHLLPSIAEKAIVSRDWSAKLRWPTNVTAK